jgi:hypothetical protein
VTAWNEATQAACRLKHPHVATGFSLQSSVRSVYQYFLSCNYEQPFHLSSTKAWYIRACCKETAVQQCGRTENWITVSRVPLQVLLYLPVIPVMPSSSTLSACDSFEEAEAMTGLTVLRSCCSWLVGRAQSVLPVLPTYLYFRSCLSDTEQCTRPAALHNIDQPEVEEGGNS